MWFLWYQYFITIRFKTSCSKDEDFDDPNAVFWVTYSYTLEVCCSVFPYTDFLAVWTTLNVLVALKILEKNKTPDHVFASVVGYLSSVFVLLCLLHLSIFHPLALKQLVIFEAALTSQMRGAICFNENCRIIAKFWIWDEFLFSDILQERKFDSLSCQ